VQRTFENYKAAEVHLSTEEIAELDNLVEGFEAKGDRYFGDNEAVFLWG
jgi:pyridoxine 4-dehydrogenase